jgi:FkbM family methyltransferase
MIKKSLKFVLKKLGYTVSRYDPARDPDAVRRWFFQSQSIRVVLDIGANTGQYALHLRKTGYRGKIVSFEPLSKAFGVLAENAKRDPNWIAQQLALGDVENSGEIHIAGNSWSSSLLPMLPSHEHAAPESAYIGKETISIRRLDSLFDEYCAEADHVFLKIDAQGYTKNILHGAERSLARINGLLVELSLIPLYDGEPVIGEVVSCLYERGFTLVYVEPEFCDRQSGQQLQVNGLFFRL